MVVIEVLREGIVLRQEAVNGCVLTTMVMIGTSRKLKRFRSRLGTKYLVSDATEIYFIYLVWIKFRFV